MARREHGTGSLLRIQYKTVLGETRETKTWYMQFHLNGKCFRESTHTQNKHEAQRQLTRRLADASAGRAPANSKVKFEEVRDSWLTFPRKRGPLRSAYTKADGTKTASGLLHIDAFFKGWPVASINERAIDQFIQARREAGAKDATIRRNLTVLRAILNYAHDNPRFGLPVPPSFKHRMPQDSKARQGFTDAADFSKILALLPAKCRPLATFQFRTGCRTGAALKITWDHVSKDCTELELPGEITKSGEPLTLPLVGDGLRDIAAHLRKQFRVAGKPIFAVGDGATNGKESYRYNWNTACDKLGLGVFDKKRRRYFGLRPHDMRRSAIINMIRAGVPRNVAMAISGHKTESIFNRYHIVETSDMRDALVRAGMHDKLAK